MLDLSGEAYQQAYQIIHTYVADTRPVKLCGAQGTKNKIWLILAQIWFDGVCRLQLWLESR